MNKDPKQRFTNRVENYVKYRPDYPNQIIDYLSQQIDLDSDDQIADIGSGTGILSKLFLDNGNYVYGVEPNANMRAAAIEYLSPYTNYSSVLASAEDTELETDSIDVIVVGQAFHWFERLKTKTEFKRILKPFGWVVLLWNTRDKTTDFGKAYHELLTKFGTDYSEVHHNRLGLEEFNLFFAKDKWHKQVFENYQELNYNQLQGRLLSSSYAPTQGDTNYLPMMEHLKEIFDANQQDGKVRMDYITELYYGQLE